MGLALIHVVLLFNFFEMKVGNPIHVYRFDVYPVDTCPMNAIEFEKAARRRNCTEKSRYLCAPDKYLSNLIEFCTDRKLSLFQNGNCVRLEGTGDLNHFRCAERFKSGCPTEPYTDEEIYKNPACLSINTKFNCFVADDDCQMRLPTSTEIYVYNTKAEDNNEKTASNVFDKPFSLSLAIIVVYIVLSVAFGTGIMNYLWKSARLEKINNGSLKTAQWEKQIPSNSRERTKVYDKEKYKFFSTRHSFLSQWHPCEFEIDGTKYNCAEQYMMHQKAELMGDCDTAAKIMTLDDPTKIKQHGREVKNFDNDLWEKNCQKIVEKGNMEKFSQNKNLREKLISTYPKILAESCPGDKIWGIGLSEDDERAWDESTWQGQNLLGKILVRVRDYLKDYSP